MARSGDCANCGVPLPSNAAFCPSCGSSQKETLLELERIDVRQASRSSVERVVTGPRGRPSRRQALGVVAAIAATAGLIAVFVGGGGSNDANTAPTTTAAPTTTTSPPPTTTARPFTATAATPPTTAPPTTALPFFLNGHEEPVLGAPTGGQSLYIANGRVVTRIELDTGNVTSAELLPDGGPWSAASLHDGALLITSGNSAYRVPLDLARPGEAVPDSRGSVYPVVGTELRWHVPRDAAANRAKLVGRDGAELASVALPAGVNVYGVIGDRLLLQSSGRIYTLDRTGRTRTYASGTIYTVNGTWVVWRSCDDQARCVYHLGSVDRADARPINLPDSVVTYDVGGAPQMISPDGAFMVAYGAQGYVLVDFAAGRVVAQSQSGYSSRAWTPDSSWMFRVSTSLRIDALATRDGRTVTITLPTAASPTASQSVLAAG